MAESPLSLSGDIEGDGFSPAKWIKLAVGLVVIAAATFAGYWYFLRDDGPATTAAKQETATVTKGQLVSSLTTTGTAASSLTSKLTFQSSGQVKSVSATIGQKVTAGTELARLDDRDAQRKIDSAGVSLESAKLRLQQLKEPPKPADVAAAQQSVTSSNQSVISSQQSVISATGQLLTAQQNLVSAQANLDKAQQPPSTADLAAADATLTSAQVSLTNANNAVSTAWSNLLNAQRVFCGYAGQDLSKPTVVNINQAPCYLQDLPLRQQSMDDLASFIRAPGGSGSGIDAAVQAASSLLSANNSYVSSRGSVSTAEKNLESAQAKRDALVAGATSAEIEQLRGTIRSAQASIDTANAGIRTAQAGVETARAGLTSAQAKLDALYAGTSGTDIALQEQSVKSAEISYQTAVDALTGLVIKAPFDGVVGAVGINVGDQAGTATAAFTLTNPDAVRVDLAVSEADITNIKAGQFGIATFDAFQGSFYLVKVTAVGNTPTVTQGVVTYPVQAQILRGTALQENAAELVKVSSALTSLGGFSRAAGGGAGAAGGGASRTPGAGAAGRTPPANFTPGAGAAGGAGALAAFTAGPLPSTGMNASVILVIDIKTDTILVPTGAVKRQGRTSYVNLLKDDGTIEQRTVVTGGADGTNTAITSGLAEGDRVVTSAIAATGTRTATVTAGGAGGFQAPPGGGNAAPGGVR